MADKTQMSEDLILRVMRAAAWERAKGELEAMMHTFYGSGEQFDQMRAALDGFIKKVEDDGLAE